MSFSSKNMKKTTALCGMLMMMVYIYYYYYFPIYDVFTLMMEIIIIIIIIIILVRINLTNTLCIFSFVNVPQKAPALPPHLLLF